jgi:DNA-binding LytR/AlgR family response regulator
VTDGGVAGAKARHDLTNGGQNGANGGDGRWIKRPELLAALAFVGFGLIYVIVNATSFIDERAALGLPMEAWRPWVLELTSFLTWLLLLPLILMLANRVSTWGKKRWVVAAHVAATVPVSLAHLGVMFAMRTLAFSLAGDRYALSDVLTNIIIYEYRKDAITYAFIVCAFLLLKRLSLERGDAAPIDDIDTIEVRDGAQLFWIKHVEVDWIEAAGNYVELRGACGTRLLRRTLSDMEAELAPYGFVRVHRSRLVRKSAISRIETRQSGDFDIMLRSGESINGSRRYRSTL